ncbi:MAG: hypothetical protein V4689_18650 [Verrucomicrobiota bacterium]
MLRFDAVLESVRNLLDWMSVKERARDAVAGCGGGMRWRAFEC